MMDKIDVVTPDRLSPNSFFCVFPDNDYKIFHNSEPSFLHHKPDHDAKALAGITIRYLSKTEFLNVTVKDKILQLQEKSSAKGERIKQLNEAYELYKTEKAKDPRTSWDDVAKKVKFLGLNGKPKGNSLRMAIEREAERGSIAGYTKP
jgi:hypothetical protein